VLGPQLRELSCWNFVQDFEPDLRIFRISQRGKPFAQAHRVMDSRSILTSFCAVEFAPGDSAELVAWSDGRFGIVRKGQEVGQEQWGRGKLAECGQAFLNYVRLIRRSIANQQTQA
jgi:hypothetical protein